MKTNARSANAVISSGRMDPIAINWNWALIYVLAAFVSGTHDH
jgi:hypothetical protein